LINIRRSLPIISKLYLDAIAVNAVSSQGFISCCIESQAMARYRVPVSKNLYSISSESSRPMTVLPVATGPSIAIILGLDNGIGMSLLVV